MIAQRIPQGFYPSTNVPLIHTPGEGKATLASDLTYVDYDGQEYVALAGLYTDGGSKPRIFWSLFGHPYDRFLPAYVIHDAMCERAWSMVVSGQATEGWKARKKADIIFVHMLEFLGASPKTARWYYKAVRTGAAWDFRGTGGR